MKQTATSLEFSAPIKWNPFAAEMSANANSWPSFSNSPIHTTVESFASAYTSIKCKCGVCEHCQVAFYELLHRKL